jgi:hypothetical protein
MIRDGLGHEVRLVMAMLQLLNAVMAPAELSQEQEWLAIAEMDVRFGASCVAASCMFVVSAAVALVCAAYETPARAALETSMLA